MALNNLPPPTGDAQSVPDNIPVWSRFFHWCFLLWQWVTSTLPRALTFGNGDGTYSAAIQSTAGQSDIGTAILIGSPVVLASRNTNGQSIPTSTYTTVTGWTNLIDSAGAFNTVSGVYTVPVAGVYIISCNFMFNTASFSASQQIAASIVINGFQNMNSLVTIAAANASNNFSPGTTCTTNFLKAGDTISFTVFQSSGAGLTLYSASPVFNWCNITRIGP